MSTRTAFELVRRPNNGAVAYAPSPLEDEPRDPYDVHRTDFPLAVRGYDRAAVDGYLEEVQRLVDDLRTGTSPQAAVRRALDEVGEETSAILQRAHQTADELTSRSEAEADRRLQEAEEEARAVRVAAEARVAQLDRDTDRIWGERQKLLDDVEGISTAVLEVREDAQRRYPVEDADRADPAAPTSHVVSPSSNGASAQLNGSGEHRNGAVGPDVAVNGTSGHQPAPGDTVAFDPLDVPEDPPEFGS